MTFKRKQSRHGNINQSQIEKGEFPPYMPKNRGLWHVQTTYCFETENCMERLTAALRKGEKCPADIRLYPKQQGTGRLYMWL